MDKSSWRHVKFGDVVRQVKVSVDPKTSGLDRYIAGEHMDTDDLRIRRWGTIGDDYLGPAFHMRFKPGQVLYGSRRTYLRKVAMPDFEGICANTTFVLEPKDPSLLIPELLPFIMQTEAFHDHSIKQSKGSVNPYVNFSDIAWYEFRLPQLPEQPKYAALFQVLNAQVDALRNWLSAHERLLRRFILDEYESANRNYPSTSVTQAGEILMGRQKAPQYYEGNNPKPFIRVANIGDLVLNTEVVEEMDFLDDEVEKYRLRMGDVLLTEGDLISARNVGRPAIFEGQIEDCCFQNTVIRFRPNDSLLPYYALILLEGARLSGLFARVAKTTTVAHLGLGRFSEVELPIPSLDAQSVAADRLLQFLKSREALRQRVVESQSLYKNLLNEAL